MPAPSSTGAASVQADGLAPDAFVARCVACVAAGGGAEDIARLVRRALISQREQPQAWGRQEVLHGADDLLIVDLRLPPFCTSALHDHGTWAVIGISQGREVDELFTEREGALERGARHELHPDDTLVLAPDSIHVYGRHLGKIDRRMWDPWSATPRRMDSVLFEQWEETLTARSADAGAIMAPTWRVD